MRLHRVLRSHTHLARIPRAARRFPKFGSISFRLALIEREIKSGTFDYLRWFPHGSKAQELGLRQSPKPISVGSYYQKWICEKKPPLVRKSQERDYRQHFNAYILPRFKDKPINQLTAGDLTAFRMYLIHEGSALKPRATSFPVVCRPI